MILCVLKVCQNQTMIAIKWKDGLRALQFDAWVTKPFKELRSGMSCLIEDRHGMVGNNKFDFRIAGRNDFSDAFCPNSAMHHSQSLHFHH